MQYSSDDNKFLNQLIQERNELKKIIPELQKELDNTLLEYKQKVKFIGILKQQIERKKLNVNS